MIRDPGPGYAALLVDIVDSRQHPSRADLQETLLGAIDATNAWIRGIRGCGAIDELAISVGDETQATYATVTAALRAAIELRLHLRSHNVEIRAGIGWGTIEVRDPARVPLAQDGPAWWHARAAIEAVATSTPQGGYVARFGLVTGEAVDEDPRLTPPVEEFPPPRPLRLDALALVDSYLALLDRSFALLDAEDAIVVLSDIHGRPADELAAKLGVGKSGVSMRRTRNHLREFTSAIRSLERV